MPQFLTLDDLLESHVEQIAAYGGSDGIRELGLLMSALAQPPGVVRWAAPAQRRL